jgi:hypothetical protein
VPAAPSSRGPPSACSRFDVIDRTHLENLLAEHRLSTRGLIDPRTTNKGGCKAQFRNIQLMR